MSDGIDKKLRNKKLELRQNIIENSTNHELKPCFNPLMPVAKLAQSYENQ